MTTQATKADAKPCANTGNGRYWHGGDGLRVGSRTFSATAPTRLNTSYVWDAGAGMPSVLQETTTDNAAPPVSKTTTYLYGLDLIAQTDNASVTSFMLTDGLGSTRELVTTGAAVVDGYHYTYDVWGGLRSAQPATLNDFRFTGEQTDVRANRGLVYLRARFYDPALGRFLNRDPLPLGNRYAYVGNSPTNYVDPLGLCPWNKPWRCADEAGSAVVNYGADVLACTQRYSLQYCPGLVLADRLATAVACKVDKGELLRSISSYDTGLTAFWWRSSFMPPGTASVCWSRIWTARIRRHGRA